MTAPESTPVGVVDNLRFEAIFDFVALAESCAVSAREAAWRGDRVALKVHLQQLRLSTIEAIKVFGELGAETLQKARAAA